MIEATTTITAEWMAWCRRSMLPVATCLMLQVSVMLPHLVANEKPPKPKVEPKTARSDFDIGEFRDFVSYDLSRPQPTGSLRDFGIETRKIYGQLVDHQGKPIADAQVAISEPVGYSGECYNENFDKTDQLGRFVVEGHIRRNRIAIRREAGQTWGVQLEPDQQSIQVVWPEPAKLLIHVDAKLCEPETTLRIQSTRYWVGLSALQRVVKLDQERAAIVEDLLPGKYAVVTSKTIKIGETEHRREIEIGRFSIDEGETKSVKCVTTGRVPVYGAFKPNTYIVADRQKEDYHDVATCADLVVVEKDGTFELGPLETGRYVLNFFAPVDPAAAPPIRGGFGRGFTGGDQLVWKKRIVITADDMEVKVPAPEQPAGIAEMVRGILDTADPMAGWSHADVQAKQLSVMSEREKVVTELLQILADPHSPQEWEHVVLKALSEMTDSPQAVDGLLNLLDKPEQAWSRPSIMTALQATNQAPRKVADAIAGYRKSEDLILRSTTYRVLAWLAFKHPELQPSIIPLLIEALDDADDVTRYSAATSLGEFKAKAAIPKLYETRKDPSGLVAVSSAWAIWQIEGTREQAIEVFTEKLLGETYNGKQRAIMHLAEFDDPSDETIAALVELAKFESKPPYNGERSAKLGFKQSAIRTLEKIAPDAVPEDKAVKKGEAVK
jgi:HEAT repeat protein